MQKKKQDRAKDKTKRIGGQRGLNKPHKCTHCPMTYHDERDLKLHTRSWHGIWGKEETDDNKN
jgi:hypothetical protein